MACWNGAESRHCPCWICLVLTHLILKTKRNPLVPSFSKSLAVFQGPFRGHARSRPQPRCAPRCRSVRGAAGDPGTAAPGARPGHLPAGVTAGSGTARGDDPRSPTAPLVAAADLPSRVTARASAELSLPRGTPGKATHCAQQPPLRYINTSRTWSAQRQQNAFPSAPAIAKDRVRQQQLPFIDSREGMDGLEVTVCR